MPAIDEINGVSAANVDELNGFTKSQVDDVNGGMSLGEPQAARWFIGYNAGEIFHTTAANAASGWEALVDLGSFSATDIVMGLDRHGEKRIIVHTKTNSLEFAHASASADLTDSNNWTTQNLNISPMGNTKGPDYGPSMAYGNGVWIAGCLTGATGDGTYEGLIKSTDGGDTWALVDLNNADPGNGQFRAVAYKGGTSGVWIVGIQDSVYRSNDNGASWTPDGSAENKIELESGKNIHCIAYDGTERWVAAATSNKIYTSDDDGASWTSRTSAVGGSHAMYSVAYAKGSIQKWICGGAAGRLQYSSDGVNWTAIWEGDDGDWGTSIIYQIATDSHTVVVVGGSGKIATSTDGINFTVQDPGISGKTAAYRAVCSDIIGAGTR